VVASLLNQLYNLLAELLNIVLGTTHHNHVGVFLKTRNLDGAVVELLVQLLDGVALLANDNLVETRVDLDLRDSQVGLQ